ncbi:MAG: CpsD/CapB family tyrosine-protein kinase [Isosphaeraceae bacterium]
MREVDDALSRAYAQRGAASPPSGVPPTPHWSSRAPEQEPTSSPSPSSSEPRSARTTSAGGRTVSWHRPGEPGGEPARPIQAIDPEPIQELQWPGIVLVLEREWSHRFEQMADRLIESRDRQNIKVLLFTSCHRAEGRTTLVLTLARALARRPGRTVLVDADLTGPMLSHVLGLHPEFGLDDVVTDGHALAEALIHSPDDHLWILPLRVAAASPREFLASPGWSCTMARLRRDFDLVLIDGSPIFTGLSAAVLHRAVDAAVLVHNRGMTGERSLLRAREVLDAGGIPLLGLAETFV